MSFSLRLFAGFLVVLCAAAALSYDVAMRQIELAFAQSAEETMVDTANLLAEIIGQQSGPSGLALRDPGQLQGTLDAFQLRDIGATIFTVSKSKPSLRVLVTDARGVVVVDSLGEAAGEDFSRWNDVYLTLRGGYGARTTRLDPDDEDTAVLYVAAPIRVAGEIVGVVTVAKSKTSLIAYRERIREALVDTVALTLAVMLLIAGGLSWWFSRSVGVLKRYADTVASDQQGVREVPVPVVAEPELNALAGAMARMRRRLDGKSYVEDYVRGLTHELKSPVAAIAGALELLDGEMSAADRSRFLANIAHETARLETITSRMLELASLEHTPAIKQGTPVALGQCVRDLEAELAVWLEQRGLTLRLQGTAPPVSGDPFLLTQAIRNVVENAIAASPPGGCIAVQLASSGDGEGGVLLTVTDQGAGVPAFALTRLSERFFALPSNETGRKSTGLGLSFVRQIMLLHGGDVTFSNAEPGLRVTLTFPPGPARV